MTYDPEVKVTWLRMRIANAELAYSPRRQKNIQGQKLRTQLGIQTRIQVAPIAHDI